MSAPWCDCKVAFRVDDPDTIWNYFENYKHKDELPSGWSTNESCMCGAAGFVFIFRVDSIPTEDAGHVVASLLQKIEREHKPEEATW